VQAACIAKISEGKSTNRGFIASGATNAWYVGTNNKLVKCAKCTEHGGYKFAIQLIISYSDNVWPWNNSTSYYSTLPY